MAVLRGIGEQQGRVVGLVWEKGGGVWGVVQIQGFDSVHCNGTCDLTKQEMSAGIALGFFVFFLPFRMSVLPQDAEKVKTEM